MKYSEEFHKPDYTKGPYPKHHSVGGESIIDKPHAQPRMTGDVLKTDRDKLAIGLSYNKNGSKSGDFGPYIQRCGEGLPNSFNLDFLNNMKFCAGNIHPHTGLILFSLALNLRPKVIIETGTYYGYSTLFLAKVCEIWKEGMVYTIDTKPKQIDNIVRSHPYIECVNGNSTKVLPELLKKVNEVQFAFLDSWKRIAFSEFKLVDPYLAEGGIVVFHDTQFLNTGKTLYHKILKEYKGRYDVMLFTGFPHKDNGHKFLGNADDRGLLVLRKCFTKDPFINAADYNTKAFGARLI